jgi:hypothetical protein
MLRSSYPPIRLPMGDLIGQLPLSVSLMRKEGNS